VEAVKRRIEFLRLEGLGLTQAEIIEQLTEKNGCTERTIYNDIESRTSWQPYLQSITKPDDVLYKIMNRHEQIYRQASRILHSAPNPMVQLGALNLMLKANSLMFDTAVLPSLMYKLKVLEQKASKGVFVP